ncbi:MAG: insulinase family protein [Bacteroidetes bacterium]|nr:insulinase family protein [Bacteroidota bacterium]
MILNRANPPELKVPEAINILQAKKIQLDNGIGIYVINSGNEDVVKFEIIYPTGATDKESFAISTACHQLAESGTSSKKAIEIAENLDYFGAYLHADSGPDFKSFSLFSLTRFFNETLPVLNEILNDAAFPENELNVWKTRSIQTLKVNREKVSWLSKTRFQEALFGNSHPYGYTPAENSFNDITIESLQLFFSKSYRLNEAIILLSGKVDAKIIATVNSVFGQINNSPTTPEVSKINSLPEFVPQKIKIDKKDSVQSAIRIGKRLFGKDHHDYFAVSIVNTILGGYFGSRLMSNIREDKGYTYGIGSGVHPFKFSGSFFITTEVGSDVCHEAIKEIYKELHRLANEPVPEVELDLVKKYLAGSFLRSLDGPFALSDRFKGLILHDLDYEFLNRYLEAINSINPLKIMEITDKHLRPESMTEVIAG